MSTEKMNMLEYWNQLRIGLGDELTAENYDLGRIEIEDFERLTGGTASEDVKTGFLQLLVASVGITSRVDEVVIRLRKLEAKINEALARTVELAELGSLSTQAAGLLSEDEPDPEVARELIAKLESVKIRHDVRLR